MKVSVISAINQLWRRGELSWKLHAAQRKIYDLYRSLPPEQREALIFCARGFGKSFLECVLALEDILQNRAVQVAICGPDRAHTKKIVKPIMAVIMKDMPRDLVRYVASENAYICDSTGSQLTLGGFDTILEGFRGQSLFNIYMEETGFAAAIDVEQYAYMLYSVLMPTLRSRVGARITHFTTPSKIVDHPLHLETLPKCRAANAYYDFTIEANPLLTPEQIEREIQTLGGRESVACQRELFCRIVRDDSITVVTTFDEEQHVAAVEPSHQLQWCTAGDYGYSRDLIAWVKGGFDHNIGKVLVRDEHWFDPSVSMTKVAEDINAWNEDKRWTFRDYRGPKPSLSVILDAFIDTRRLLTSAGLSTAQPIKDRFEETITYLRNEFYNDRVVIHPDCKLLIETLRSAVFNKNKTDFMRTSSLGHADMLMALVYLLRSVDRTTDLRPKPNPADVITFAKPAWSNITDALYQAR